MKLTSRIIAIIGAAAIVVVLAAGWLLGVSPLLSQAAASDAARAEVEAQNVSLQAKVAEMKTQFDNIADYEASLAKIGTLVPDEEDLAIFYTQVAVCEAAFAITPDIITTEDAAAYLMPDGTDPLLIAPTASLAAKLHSIKVVIKFKGTLGATFTPDTTVSFLDCLHQGLRVFTPVSVETTADSGGNATITGYLYRVTDPNEIPGRLAPDSDDAAAPGDDASPAPTDPATPVPTDTSTPTARGEG